MSELIEPAPHARWGWPADTALWFGMLGPPIVALLHQQVSYVLVPKYCHEGSALWLRVTSIACLAIVIVAGITALSCLARARPEGAGSAQQEESPLARPHFMAMVGVFSSALSLLIIIAQAIATFMLDPCRM
jgi:hypothetical protein